MMKTATSVGSGTSTVSSDTSRLSGPGSKSWRRDPFMPRFRCVFTVPAEIPNASATFLLLIATQVVKDDDLALAERQTL